MQSCAVSTREGALTQGGDARSMRLTRIIGQVCLVYLLLGNVVDFRLGQLNIVSGLYV